MSKGMQIIVGIFLILATAILVSCAPAVAPAPVSPAPAAPAPAAAGAPAAQARQAQATPSRAAWEIQWEKVVEGAKGERGVVLYTSIGGEQRQTIVRSFESKYGVRVESVTGSAGENQSKIQAQQRAGIYAVDVWLSGSATYIPIKDQIDSLEPALVLPELKDPDLIKKTWFFGEVPWASDAHTALISLMKFTQPLSANTTLVKAGEIKSYRDLLDPKWKGKMSLQDPTIDGMGRMWFAAALELGDVDMNFMRELATKQDLFVTRDRRLQVDWLARGKTALAIAPYTAMVTEFIGLGTPINRFNIGTAYVSGSTSGIAILKKMPHPNAAKLFINWLLSQEGQSLHSKAVGAQSQRLDASTAHLDPSELLKPGIKVYRADNEEFSNKRNAVYFDLAKQVFAP